MFEPSVYSDYIYISRYSRYLEKENRRETWSETVSRYFDFFQKFLKENNNFELTNEDRFELEQAILSHEIMPSMRALMTAGKALERDSICGYNCAYFPVDSFKSFDELMYITMCGTGVGYSVENVYVKQLPVIPEIFYETDTTVVFEDSRTGWAKGLREFVSLLALGRIPKYDVSKLRPKGARLKITGGRSSGPEPLVELLDFLIVLFQKAAGRKFTSLEVHDILCKIGDIVVVGGVRRSAFLSLSDLEDFRMRDAKTGTWWNTSPHRRLSNNSAVYNEMPDIGTFMKEWVSLYQSKSGERGIFNRYAVENVINNANAFRKSLNLDDIRYRELHKEFGCNPCCLDGDTWIHTIQGPKKIKDLNKTSSVLWYNGTPIFSPNGSWIAGQKEVFQILTKEGFTIVCTDDHRLMGENGLILPKDLNEGDKLSMNEQKNVVWYGKGFEEEGYLLGAFVGDGNWNINKNMPNRSPFGEVKVFKKDIGADGIKEEIERCWNVISLKRRRDARFWRDYDKYSYSVFNISSLPLKFGMKVEDKHDLSMLEECSSDFCIGFLRGFFDADGHTEMSEKSSSVCLSQARFDTLQVIQRMLLRLGIFSRIYKMNNELERMMPDGKGGKKLYNCQTMYKLSVASSSIPIFAERVGFSHTVKKEKLSKIVGERIFYSINYSATFTEMKSLGIRDVYDIEVNTNEHLIDANGFVVHNSEIILRPDEFCNLTSVQIYSDDTPDTLKRKIRLATILGTIQACLTNFRYINKKWQRNCEDERLLGVSLNGIFDNKFTNGTASGLLYNFNLPTFLQELKTEAIKTNLEWSKKIGINSSVAISALKPEGTTSQLCGTSPGINPNPAQTNYYIRYVRNDIKDPLVPFMIDHGFLYEKDAYDPTNVVCFKFPCKVSADSLLNISAVEHLELWKTYQIYYTEHKPSTTIMVKENEWLDVGAWVYKNFEWVSGVAFLPAEEGDRVYKQAPYTKCTKEEYESMLELMPKTINWSVLNEYEHEDTTTNAQELSCAAGNCNI